MANKQTTKTQVEVCIFIAIKVPNMATFRAANKKRIRGYSLERTRDSHGQGGLRAFVDFVRARSTLSEHRFLAIDDLFYLLRIDRERLSKHKSSFHNESANNRKTITPRHSFYYSLNYNPWLIILAILFRIFCTKKLSGHTFDYEFRINY